VTPDSRGKGACTYSREFLSKPFISPSPSPPLAPSQVTKMASEKEEPAVSVSPSLSDQGVPSPTMKIDEAVPMVSDEEDSKLSKRITRKCDLRLVPMLASLYLVAFLDRANIANARLLGFEKDLNMPSNGYNTAIWIFFLSFVLLEVPSNLLLGWSKIPPHLWLGGMCILLGIVTMCQGFTASAGGLYACRFIMGIFEGALAPAAALLMGQYYRRKEFALRYATFVCFALLGSAFSSVSLPKQSGARPINKAPSSLPTPSVFSKATTASEPGVGFSS
jgi:hypothetical protein